MGRSELRLISPDRKQILLHRAFKDVASCVLGRANKDHFGFVCRETNDTYACYVFKCESDSVATEVVSGEFGPLTSSVSFFRDFIVGGRDFVENGRGFAENGRDFTDSGETFPKSVCDSTSFASYPTIKF